MAPNSPVGPKSLLDHLQTHTEGKHGAALLVTSSFEHSELGEGNFQKIFRVISFLSPIIKDTQTHSSVGSYFHVQRARSIFLST